MAETDTEITTLPRQWLPGKLREIADYCGEDVMWALWKHYGGGHVSIPQTPDPTHRLAAVLTPQQLARLCQSYGRETLDIPKAEAAQRAVRNGWIRQLRRQGWTVFELARKFNLTERWVIDICGQGDAPDYTQQDLFD